MRRVRRNSSHRLSIDQFAASPTIVETGPGRTFDDVVRRGRIDPQKGVRERFDVDPEWAKKRPGPARARRGTRQSQPQISATRAPIRLGRSAHPGAWMPRSPSHPPNAIQAHLDKIAKTVARVAHAVPLLGRARWHTIARLEMPTSRDR